MADLETFIASLRFHLDPQVSNEAYADKLRSAKFFTIATIAAASSAGVLKRACGLAAGEAAIIWAHARGEGGSHGLAANPATEYIAVAGADSKNQGRIMKASLDNYPYLKAYMLHLPMLAITPQGDSLIRLPDQGHVAKLVCQFVSEGGISMASHGHAQDLLKFAERIQEPELIAAGKKAAAQSSPAENMLKAVEMKEERVLEWDGVS